jgi:hypothetical protein
VDDVTAGQRMRLRMRVHEVSRTTAFRRVLTPAFALGGTHLTRLLWNQSGALFSCRADLLRLGALFRLAATSPHSAVWLPLRANRPEPASLVELWGRDNRGLADLVVVRAGVPLRPSAWPRVRERVRASGALRTMRSPAPRPVPELQGCRRPDGLVVAEHAGTVFMSGAAADLLVAGDGLTDCGDLVADDPDIHRFGGPVTFGQFRGPDPRLVPGRRRDTTWECDVLAEDQFFHRVRGGTPLKTSRR